MHSIRTRMVLLVLAGGGILLTAGGLALGRRIDRELQAEFDRALVAKARTLATLMKVEPASPWGIDFDFADEFMPEFDAEQAPEYFQLWFGDGTMLEPSRSLGGESLPILPIDGGREQYQDLVLPDGRAGRAVQIDFIPQNEGPTFGPWASDRDGEAAAGLGSVAEDFERRYAEAGCTFVVARGRDQLVAEMARMHGYILGTGGVLLLGLVGLMLLAGRMALRPLALLGHTLDEIEPGSMQGRVALPGAPRELSPLVSHVNSLLERLERSFQRERRFSSDVAHELLSPVSKLRLMSEVAGMRPELDAGTRDTLDDIDQAARRIERIVQDLLVISRAEWSSPHIDLAEVPVDEVTDETCADLEPDARERGVSVRVNGARGLVVRADREKLGIVVRNLLGNAVHHGRAGGEIEVSWVRGPQGVSLSVRNPVEEMDEADLTCMFDRFWRKDDTRPADGHVGLGLSIVQAIADLLGWKVTAELGDGGVLSMSVRGI